jgi:L-ascorbate metabolism protein UlaG (beta-lactamase superfamily)
MKITKYEHSALVLEINGHKVIVDPGMYTKTMPEQHNVKAIVITHIHDDHCFEPQLDKILALNPGIKIYSTDEVCRRLAESRPNFETVAVHHGDHYKEGDFTIDFYGDMHLEIHSSWPICQNVGVMINNTLYYPGDSFTIPDVKVPMLAVPSTAPWSKVGMMIDFVDAVKPNHSFATHNIHLSEEGHELYNGRIKMFTEAHGGTFTHLEPGESLEV